MIEFARVRVEMSTTDLGHLGRKQASELIDELLTASDRDLYEETNDRKEELVEDPSFYPNNP